MNAGKAKSSPGSNPEKQMRPFALVALLALMAPSANAAERWATLPPTPAPIATDRSGEAEANGIKIHYAIYGQGSPVIFLHGASPTPTIGATRSPPWLPTTP
jgi:hypothetical protein